MKTFQILTEAYGDETLSLAHAFEWCKKFSGVEEDESVGRPRSTVTDQNIAKIHDMRFQGCDEDIGTWMVIDGEDCGFQMLNDDEIVISVQKSDPVDDETDEDEDNNNNESSKCPSNANRFFALETAMEWYEQQPE
ncbi:uncharacterized protein TNCV_3546021 [Trichonephila clavipes]|nr:uncharacterized protein TNCV_3546021 [Trichonephila clavipes]